MRARLVLGCGLLLIGCGGGAGTGPLTVAEVAVVRPTVQVGGRPVGDAERLATGAAVTVAEGGRAWLAHDAALRLLLDGGSRVTVADTGVQLDAGRVWVDAGEGARARISAGAIEIAASGAGFEAARRGEALHLTVARGELTFRLGDKRGQVRAGETAELSPGGADVHPEPLWDDWTGGLAWPDPAHGGPRTLGEIGARRPGSLGEARFPLAITRLEVRTVIRGDLAQTRVIQTFFNPASDTLEGLYRVRVPEGALLARFAIDRNGRWADGYVKERETARAQYQAQVYEGSTKDPALLEWEAPGRFRARIYPIPPGATRRLLVEYSEWLTPHGDGGRQRTFRFPMAGPADGPVIQELDVEIDTEEAEAKELRAGLGARIEPHGVILERTDFRPRADLVVNLVGQPRDEAQARGYKSPHRVRGATGAHEDDYYLALPVPLALEPAAARPPLDLAIVADVSAGTDATHLQLGRTFVESVLRHLDDKDRVAVVGADLGLHPLPVGSLEANQKASLLSATRPNVDKMLDALARASTGGATDLGATLSDAAALVGAEPGRRGAVIYVGDALPTVGEIDVKALRERLDRLPVPLRLYGVAIGDDADLALLEGLASDGGLALRVGDRAQAADAALRLLGHAEKRAAFRVKVDLGAGVDRIYPRRPTAVVEGDALPILARVRSGVPSEVTITGVLDGKPFTAKRRLSSATVSESSDLRLRWSMARLSQLLADGASSEEVAELGTRQNLITPFTSYYVPSADELRPTDQEESEGGDEKSVDFYDRGGRHKGEEGKMGKKEAPKKPDVSRLFGGAKDESAPMAQSAPTPTTVAVAPAEPEAPPPPAAAPMPAPKAAMEEYRRSGAADIANNSGILAALGRDKAGDDNGLGGLGLRGTGPGGGGTGEGQIGLGNLGTLGGGSHHGSGQGYGRGAGGPTTKATTTAAPTVALGDPQVRGALDKEIVRRIIRVHINEARYCYERGLLSHPGIQGRVQLQFTIGPTGTVVASTVQQSTLGDAGVEQCVAQRVRAWQFPKPAGGGVVIVSYPFVFTGGGHGMLEANEPRELYAAADDRTVIEIHIGINAHRAKHCSPASKLDAADRYVLWRERLEQHGGIDGALEVWQDAKSTCELKNWGDRRELLRAMLSRVGGAAQMVGLYRRFDDSPAEQDFLRRAILGQVRSANDLRIIYDGLGLSEDVKSTLVDEVLAKAKSPADRVTALQQLQARWPQDLRLKLKLMEALEAAGRPNDARRVADEVRKSPSPDAQARTLIGEFLARQGDEPAARRAFSEIVEFAPRDPVARRRLGDLYRAHGWFEEAYRQYQTLATLSPGDQAVLLLQASAAAGAGRTDEALRLEQRVSESTEPGSEAGIARAALWWSTVRQAGLRESARKAGDAAEVARLLGRARRTGVLRDARPFRAFLTWAHPEADCELFAAFPGAPLTPASEVAPEFGLAGISSRDPVNGPVSLLVKRPAATSGLKYQAKLLVLWDEGGKEEQLREVPLEFGPGVAQVRVAVNGREVEVLR